MNYQNFFEKLTSPVCRPHDWQSDLAAHEKCTNRLIRIPTGFGKTLGALTVWLWHRIQRQDNNWPRRLVWCLPIRVLVEQTEQETRAVLDNLGVLWDGESEHSGKVGVHPLMGGVNGGDWHLYPEHCAVLIGTQDMLLSRAMNRGYAAPRARWPMEFGLLNQDCLWVMDEVQLMDVGLATSGQLQAFRGDDADKGLTSCHTWWMSATLQQSWLQKSPDTGAMVSALPAQISIPASNRKGHLWSDVHKPCILETVKDTKALAALVRDAHVQEQLGANGPTVVVLNTVDRAIEVFDALGKFKKELKDTEIKLVHSRFRLEERKAWRTAFLNKDACAPGTNRIIVATQVVEAGVDISAALLVTELAPWASLVQRFGRSARWGGTARVIVADLVAGAAKAAVEKARKKAESSKKKVKKEIDVAAITDSAEAKVPSPYALDELRGAREALARLTDVGPLHLEAFEEAHPDLLPRLYPFEPTHLLLRHELDELFDTTPDLSGADIDTSRYIRSGDERDLQVFWMDVPEKTKPSPDIKPAREALCAVPFLKAREWLCGDRKASHLKKGMRAWVWDWQDGDWRVAEQRDLYPGQTVLVAARCGGYDYDPDTGTGKGWDPKNQSQVPEVFREAAPKRKKQCWWVGTDGHLVISEKEVRANPADEIADAGQDSEALSVAERWKTIATHGRETGQTARDIVDGLAPELAGLFSLAGRWHDAGKAHPAFQASIRHEVERPERDDIAKAPDAAWPCSTKQLYSISTTDRRPGFRHELASVLALFGVLLRHNPDHPALLGPWRELLTQAGMNARQSAGEEPGKSAPTPIEQEILALNADQFNLLAYLVCAHHGKVRLAWHAGKGDQSEPDNGLRIRGVREGDILPPLPLTAGDGKVHELPATVLDLAPAKAGLSPRTGAAWTDRVLGLLAQYGPFTLAWLEALLRAADQRASRITVADPVLEADNGGYELERSDTTVARPASGGAQTAPPAGDSASRGPLHGDGRGTRGREHHPGTTRPPHSATRYLETQLGILSYQQLAPHLAERVALTEFAIGERKFGDLPIDETLILDLHHRICGELVPSIAGCWRTREVQVGDHRPPASWRVPMLMRDYTADLAVRIAHSPAGEDERQIETLVFAEGQLLHIHPFEDFNGRVTRLFLIELLYRLQLPIVDPATDQGEETMRYFTALRAYDRGDRRPLTALWRERFEKGAEE